MLIMKGVKKMREIQRNCHGTEFAVWIDKEEKNLLEDYAKLKELYNKEATLLIINPEAYFGYDIKRGKAVALKFEEIKE